MSKTEFQLILMGQQLADRPAPMIYVGPTQSQVGKISLEGGRFDGMLESTPALRELIDPRLNLSRSYSRTINGVPVLFAWAGSPSEVASNPVRLAIVDELDKMETSALENVRARTKAYPGRLLVAVSTPTYAGGSNIASQFEEGTRERWHWRCPHCEAWFYPRLALLTWPKGSKGDELREAAAVACAECGGMLTEEDRQAVDARWFPTVPPGGDSKAEHDLRVDIRPRLSHRSFAVSGLATWSMTIGEIAEIYARALRSRDEERIREVVNDYGGEAFAVKGDSPAWSHVWGLRESYDRPAGVRMVTLGADPAGDRIDYVIRGWGFNAESWLAEHGTLWGSTEHDDVFLALQALSQRQFFGLPITRGLVDSGFATAKVYQLARRSPVLEPSKGHATLAKPFYDSHVDESPRGTVVKTGVKLWHFSNDYWKVWLYGRMRWPPGTPGAWHVHDEITEQYARQVVNEQAIALANGGRRWVTTGDRQNHLLDCEVLAAVAAHIGNVMALPPHAPPPAPTNKTPPRAPRGGFHRHGV